MTGASARQAEIETASDEAAAPGSRGLPRSGVPVLVTGGEFVSVLATIRALRAAGHVPWATVHGPGTFAARSRATEGTCRVPWPGRDPNGFVVAVARATARIGAEVIIPGTEIAAQALAARIDRLPPGVAVGIGPGDSLGAVTDKTRLEGFARAAGLHAPPSVLVHCGAIPGPLPFQFPVVVKPPRSEQRDARGYARHYGAALARSTAEVRAAVDVLPEGSALVQPFLDGRLISLSGVFWDGTLVCAVQSVADRLWPMPCGSISAGRTVALDRWLASAVGDLLRPTGWRGLFQVDLIEGGDGLTLIDLNPRVFISLSHATRAGVNLPAIWVDLLLGRTPTVSSTYRVGVRYRHDEGDPRALAGMFLRGQRRAALAGLVPHPDTAYAVFAPDDPLPLMTSVERTIRYVGRAVRALLDPAQGT